MNAAARSFSPLIGSTAHTLILGSMPGQASLKSVQYYAHPRNAFWPIMLAIIDGSPPSLESTKRLSYEQRCEKLTGSGYALWDVLAQCNRPGSLDSRIVRSSEIPNDIASLVNHYPELSTIACNGRMAEKLFRRHILSSKTKNEFAHDRVKLCCLPSSSPAMASLTLDRKHQLWAEGLLG